MNIFYTGLISAIVSVLTALAAFQMRVLGDSLLLRKQHEWDQRRELRKLVARYHARLLEAALDWDRRMQQAYAGEYRWLSPSGSDRTCREQYFFHSMIYRFLALLTAARDFEKEAFFIDARISDRQKELVFLRFAKSFIWAMTHGDLTPEDGMPGRDHFPNDMFKALLDRCAKPTTLSAPAHAGANSESPVARGFFDWDTYWWFIDGLADLPAPRRAPDDDQMSSPESGGLDRSANDDSYVNQVLDFFVGMQPAEVGPEGQEPRRRWDRLVCLHLLTLAFIGTFGYSWQQDVAARVDEAVGQLRPDGVAANAFDHGGRLFLGLAEQDEFKHLCSTLRSRWSNAMNTAMDIRNRRKQVARLRAEYWRNAEGQESPVATQIEALDREIVELMNSSPPPDRAIRRDTRAPTEGTTQT